MLCLVCSTHFPIIYILSIISQTQYPGNPNFAKICDNVARAGPGCQPRTSPATTVSPRLAPSTSSHKHNSRRRIFSAQMHFICKALQTTAGASAGCSEILQ